MSVKPVFCVRNCYPYRLERYTEFERLPGSTTEVRKKNTELLQAAYTQRHPGERLLEVSEHSLQEEGQRLGQIKLRVMEYDPVKKLVTEQTMGAAGLFRKKEPKREDGLSSLCQDGSRLPLKQRALWLEYLYILELAGKEENRKILKNQDAFTDLSFTPAKGKSCAAAACALYASLLRAGKTDCLKSFSEFLQEITGEGHRPGGKNRRLSSAA